MGGPEAARLTERLEARWAGRTLEWLATCGSTNDLAARRGRELAPHGLCVIADEQTAGRGRQGRSWFAPPGSSLLLSLLVRPEVAPHALPPLGLAIGVAAWRTAESFGVEASLKWPNDLLVRGRKLGGILLEAASEGRAIRFAVIGVGLNVNVERQEFPVELAATSFRAELGRSLDRIEVAARLLEAMEQEVDRFVAQGPGPALAEFRQAARPMLGRKVRIRGGGVRGGLLVGIAEQIDEEGLLLVRDRSGEMRKVLAGEVELVGRATG